MSGFLLSSKGVLAVCAVALMAACGGGGNKGTTPGTGSGPGTVTVKTPGSAPAWIAWQDGNGPWKSLSPSASYSLQVTDAAGRYGLALATGPNSFRIWQATVTELPAISVGSGLAPVLAQGTVSGLQPADQAEISMGFGYNPISNANPSYSFWVPAGAYDLVSNTYAGTPQLHIQRNVLVQTNPTTLPDLGLTTGYTPASETVTVSGLGSGDTGYAESYLLTARHTNAWIGGNQLTGNVGTVATAPQAMLGAGDLSFVMGYASDDATSTERYMAKYVTTPGSLALTLPGRLAAPTFTFNTTDITRIQGQWPGAPVGTTFCRTSFQQTQAAATITCSAILTKGWLAGSGSTSYLTPTFSGVSGYDLNWVFSSGLPVSWAFSAFGSTDGWISGAPTIPANKAGDTEQSSTVRGTLSGLPGLAGVTQPQAQPDSGTPQVRPRSLRFHP